MEKKSLSWILLLVLSLIWGSSFILMKRGLESFSSEQVAALRISIACLFLLPLLPFHFRKVNFRQKWPALLGMGLFGNFIPAFLFTKAETGISSSLTGMLNSLTPLFTILLGWMFFKLKRSGAQTLGVSIAFVGALILLYQPAPADGNPVNGWCSVFVILATFCYALSVNIIKRYLEDVPSVSATVVSFALIGLPALLYVAYSGFFSMNFNADPVLSSLGYISILAIFGSALSVIAFNELIRISGAVFASSCTYLIPVVALAWGMLDGEPLRWYQGIGLLVILLGVYKIK